MISLVVMFRNQHINPPFLNKPELPFFFFFSFLSATPPFTELYIPPPMFFFARERDGREGLCFMRVIYIYILRVCLFVCLCNNRTVPQSKLKKKKKMRIVKKHGGDFLLLDVGGGGGL